MVQEVGQVLGGTGVSGLGGVSGAGMAEKSADVAGASVTGFSDALQSVVSQSVQQIKASETVSLSGVMGSASTQEVVQSVMEAERTLQTAIAVRNKVVEAYLEISRMQI